MKWIDKGGVYERHILVDDAGEIRAEVTRNTYTRDWQYKDRTFISLEAAQKAAEYGKPFIGGMPQANTGE